MLAPIAAAAVFLAGCGLARPGALPARGYAVAAHQREPTGGAPAGSRSALARLAMPLLHLRPAQR